MKPINSIRFLVLIFSIAIAVLSGGGCQKDSEEEIVKAPPPTKAPPTPAPVYGANTNPLPPWHTRYNTRLECHWQTSSDSWVRTAI